MRLFCIDYEENVLIDGTMVTVVNRKHIQSCDLRSALSDYSVQTPVAVREVRAPIALAKFKEESL